MPQRQSKKRKSKPAARSQPAQDKRKEKAPGPLDPEFCHSSESDPEDYGDLHGQEEWEIDGVVDSHCGENGRMSYKIRWNKEDWQRTDGTSEEWIPEPTDTRSTHANLIKKYNARELNKLGPLETQPFSIGSKDDTYYSYLYSGAPGCSKNIWNQTNYLAAFGMGDVTVSRFSMTDPDFIPEDNEDDSDSSQDVDHQPPPGTSNAHVKREHSGSISLGGTPHPNTQHATLTPLQELEKIWNRAASDVGAGPITLKNNIDKSIPPLRKGFEYSEMSLRWSPEVRAEGYPPGPEAFTTCDCSECDINYAYKCGCQDLAFDDNRPRKFHKFAYDRNGRYNLNFKGISVECNESCRCPATCPNRVIQRPRNVHIEIVKFEIRGWGVRSRENIKAGQVLGSFTGEVITKVAASRISSTVATVAMSTNQKTKFRDRKEYMFDLDSQHNKYTLDCWGIGNWTRFVNHSCEPNLRVVSVFYDTLPHTGLERLALVALRNIPAGEEFGFDYCPGAEPGKGTTPCSCGSQNCRGYI